MDPLNYQLRKLRTDYSLASLDENMVAKDPFSQFGKWFNEAMDTKVMEANAMTLATVNERNQPSARIVLLRDFNPSGFSFFTNYKSSKGHDMDVNPNACVNFFWPELQRQVRIEGIVKKIAAKDSDDYFNSRPEESRLGAWTSPQSEVISGRKWLDEQFELQKKKFEGKEITRPDWWGGYLLEPNEVEFWQGRTSRLHDRIVYRKEADKWMVVRKAP